MEEQNYAFPLDEYLYDEALNDELHDCFLSQDEIEEMMAPPTEAWKDVSSTAFRTRFTIDEAKEIQWEEAKNEITFVLEQMKKLLKEEHERSGNDYPFDDESPMKKEDIIKFIVGPESSVGKILWEQLSLSEELYLKFLETLCIQAAYKVSVSQLFDPPSLLRHTAPISKDEYVNIWKEMATKKEWIVISHSLVQEDVINAFGNTLKKL